MRIPPAPTGRGGSESDSFVFARFARATTKSVLCPIPFTLLENRPCGGVHPSPGQDPFAIQALRVFQKSVPSLVARGEPE